MKNNKLSTELHNNTTGIAVIPQSTELEILSHASELINPIIDTPITFEHLQQVIINLPNTTFVRLYNNDVFENDSHIMKLCGNWYFWHSVKCKLMSWDWEKDIDALLSDYKDDPDELSEFTSKLKNSWFFYVHDEFDMFALEDIINVISSETPLYITLNDLLCSQSSQEDLLIQDISSIINSCKNPNESAVEIVNLINKRFKIFQKFI